MSMEKALRHSSKLASIGQLAAGIGHEINNPLAIIKGYVDKNVNMDRGLPQDVKDEFGKIQVSVKRIVKIVSGLRTFARASSKNKVELFNGKKALQNMENMLSEIYENNGVRLLMDMSNISDDYAIKGDQGKFEQVLLNLLSNAKDATEGQKERIIAVKGTLKGGEIVIEVEDNGSGIPLELREKIFDPFYTSKEVGKGTGIGLSIVNQFVYNDFNGTIDVSSVEGVGTKFVISFPAILSIEGRKLAQNNASVSAPKAQSEQFDISVILVDDEEDIRDLLKTLLESIGIKVETFENGKDAYHEYIQNSENYDLIISDMKMPVMDGVTLLKSIRNDSKIKQPIFFFMTGGVNIDFENEENEINKLIDGYFYKPFSREIIIMQIKQVFKSTSKKVAV